MTWTPEDVDDSRELTTHIAENEALLSFTDDIMGELFSEWWNSKGIYEFLKYANKEAKKRGE